MSGQQQHIIHSLRYEVHFEGIQAADQQNALSRIHREKVLDLLEQLFDTATTHDRYICIDRLELDLGDIPLESWQQDLIEELSKSLPEKLDQLYIDKKIALTPYRDQNKRESDEVLIFTHQERAEDIFLFFIHYGYQKWNVAEDHSLSVNTLFEEILIHKSEHFNRQLKSLLSGSEASLRRFVIQLHPRLQCQWFNDIEPAAGESLQGIHIFQEQVKKESDISQSIIEDIFLNLKVKMIRYALQSDSKSFSAEEFIRENASDFSALLKTKRVKLNVKKQVKQSDYSGNKIIQLLSSLLFSDKKDIDGKSILQAETDHVLQKDTQSSEKQKKDLKSIKNKHVILDAVNETDIKDIENVKMQDLKDGILAVNSGLILLWPYMDILFTELRLMKEHQFIDIESKTKALFILHYLATGSRSAEEHELLIPGIFTDYDPEIIVTTEADLKKEVYTECEQLLKTAIINWSALKSTSPGGLRETFLQRHALIKLTDDGWQFMFERKGVDVLIDRLPYGLSVIRLKWLDNPIYVTW